MVTPAHASSTSTSVRSLLLEFSLPRRQRLHLLTADALAATVATRSAGRRSPRSPTTSSSPVRPRRRRAPRLRWSRRDGPRSPRWPSRTRCDSSSAPPRTSSARIPRRGRRRWRCRPPPCAAAAASPRRSAPSTSALRAVPATSPTRAVDPPAAGSAAARPVPRRRRRSTIWRRSSSSIGLAGDQTGELDALLALGRARTTSCRSTARSSRPPARATYEEALRLAEELARPAGRWSTRSMPDRVVHRLLARLRADRRANAARAVELAREIGDPDLLIDAEFSDAAHARCGTGLRASAEDLLVRLEARRDPIRLKEHCFWMMWVYLGAAEFDRCVDDLRPGHRARRAARIGAGAVRIDQGDRAHSSSGGSTRSTPPSPRRSPTTTTRSARPIAQLARTDYLVTVGALEQAAVEGVAAFDEATMVSRRLDAAVVGQPAHVGACTVEP